MPKQLRFEPQKDGSIELVEGVDVAENSPVLEQGELFERDRYRAPVEPRRGQGEMFGTGENQRNACNA